MTKLIFVRHGHVEGLSPERFRGRWDVPLTHLGRTQAKATATHVAELSAPRIVYAGPLRRALETGGAIAEACGIACETMAELNDIDYGSWQGRTHTEVQHESPVLFARWLAAPHLIRFPNGEALQDVIARAANALRFIVAHHPDETVVLVSHDSLGRALMLQLMDQPSSAYWRLNLSPCGVSEINIEGANATVIGINDTSHLRAFTE